MLNTLALEVSAQKNKRTKGFTLIEIMITIVLLLLLSSLAMYSLKEWINNNKVRSTAEVLMNGLRKAQAEATSRNRTVILTLAEETDFAEVNKPLSSLKVATEAAHWAIFVTPLSGSSEDASLIDLSVQEKTSQGVRISGPSAICFNSLGRLVTRSSTNVKVGNASCNSNDIPATYDLFIKQGDARTLRLIVGVGGNILMCDPNKTAGSSLDACP